MIWDDPGYQDKVDKLERLFTESGHGLVSDHIENQYGAVAPDAPFTKRELFEAILDGKPAARYAEYVEGKLKSLRHLRDKRTPIMYACDLLTGWLIEDLLFLVLEKQGFRPTLAGEDRQREFLKRPTEAPDLLIHIGDREVLVDIMKSDKDTWTKYRKLHLRDNKYFRLRDAKALLLAIDLNAWQFAVIDIARTKSKHTPSHWPYGNKPAQEIDLKVVEFHPLDLLSDDLPVVLNPPLDSGRRRS